MMSARPMDRLLCGDVGFGKTEVAIRAAFKAVVDGKQVAILVPTTVLAEQHLKSFRERLSMSGARVECVSRFRTTAETREIMDATRAGKVDVLIGTHKLLSKELEFRDLGLVVIDEEQRFGVQHKERLKQLRATVDMLTMSATPIPRTLELSLLGIRDLSMITTPPAGRLAVRTHLAKFTESVVREAILNEIQRGGQVFFVHNRVETIFNVADRIAQMVPEAKVLVAHAQMRDVELEDVMMRFLNREGQVLVSTTIVESGLDVANANTIFINEAQNFGLSQLHQLRGRVGRGSDRAFCYLLVADPRKLTEEARRRLDVIQEHSDLGSGLQIAHQDLDLRGAGNVLGRDQSGHIESIGFELFSELLEEAVAELKGEEVEARYEPEVKIPVAAFIPDDYIEDVSQRLAFYKRFSLAESNDQLFDIHGEIEDRYGRAPIAVTGLRDIVSLKITMKRLGANRIEGGPKAMVVELLPTTTVVPDKLIALMEAHRGKWEFRPGMVVVRHLKGAESTDMLGSALAMARDLMHCLPESP
jgi:transcription-repair coupling factor (superfamily II helicase)